MSVAWEESEAAIQAEMRREKAERALVAFLREPETIDAIRWGHDYFYDLGESARAARFKALLSKLDALGDAGTDDGGRP